MRRHHCCISIILPYFMWIASFLCLVSPKFLFDFESGLVCVWGVVTPPCNHCSKQSEPNSTIAHLRWWPTQHELGGKRTILLIKIVLLIPPAPRCREKQAKSPHISMGKTFVKAFLSFSSRPAASAIDFHLSFSLAEFIFMNSNPSAVYRAWWI